MSTCVICTEKLNKTTRKPIKCCGCQNEACTTCVKAYLLGSPHDPHCMFESCRIQWTHAFMQANFPHAWVIGPYAEKEKRKIVDLEKAMIPATMPFVETIRNRKTFLAESERIRPLLADIEALTHDITMWSFNVNRGNLMSHEARNNPPVGLMRDSIRRLKTITASLAFCENLEFDEDEKSEGPTDSKARKQFIRPCPAPNCNGMLSSGYVCGLCSTKVCATCFAIKRLGQEEVKEDHHCKEDDIKTADLIRKETKQCPKCAVSIFKIEGCNQMWCTNCNTAFDWRTNQVINGNIHNPHFFEWQRMQNGTGPAPPQGGPPPAGGCIWPEYNQRQQHWYYLRNNLHRLRNCMPRLGDVLYEKFSNFIRAVFHLADWAQLRPYAQMNVDFRIKYILGELDEATFADKVWTTFKSSRFDTGKADIVEMLHRAGQSLFNALEQDALEEKKWDQCKNLNDCLLRLITYYNQCMWDHHKAFKSQRAFVLIKDDTFDIDQRRSLKNAERPE